MSAEHTEVVDPLPDTEKVAGLDDFRMSSDQEAKRGKRRNWKRTKSTLPT